MVDYLKVPDLPFEALSILNENEVLGLSKRNVEINHLLNIDENEIENYKIKFKSYLLNSITKIKTILSYLSEYYDNIIRELFKIYSDLCIQNKNYTDKFLLNHDLCMKLKRSYNIFSNWLIEIEMNNEDGKLNLNTIKNINFRFFIISFIIFINKEWDNPILNNMNFIDRYCFFINKIYETLNIKLNNINKKIIKTTVLDHLIKQPQNNNNTINNNNNKKRKNNNKMIKKKKKRGRPPKKKKEEIK